MAQRLGISYQALLKHIKSGSVKPVMVGKKRMFDPAKTVQQFDDNVDLAMRRAQKQPAKLAQRPTPARPIAPAAGLPADGKAAALNTAKTAKETYLAKLKELEYQEKKGLLLNREQVRDKEFQTGRALRDRLLALPAQIRPFLIDGAMSEMEQLIDDIIKDLQNDIENIAR